MQPSRLPDTSGLLPPPLFKSRDDLRQWASRCAEERRNRLQVSQSLAPVREFSTEIWLQLARRTQAFFAAEEAGAFEYTRERALAYAFAGDLIPHVLGLLERAARSEGDSPARTRGEHLADPATDDSAFRPAKEMLKEPFGTYKAIQKVLCDNSWIRRRYPRRNRLEIHAGDWSRFLASRAPNDPLDNPAAVIDAIIETRDRQVSIRAQRRGK
jgi:hypothetical protein